MCKTSSRNKVGLRHSRSCFFKNMPWCTSWIVSSRSWCPHIYAPTNLRMYRTSSRNKIRLRHSCSRFFKYVPLCELMNYFVRSRFLKYMSWIISYFQSVFWKCVHAIMWIHKLFRIFKVYFGNAFMSFLYACRMAWSAVTTTVTTLDLASQATNGIAAYRRKHLVRSLLILSVCSSMGLLRSKNFTYCHIQLVSSKSKQFVHWKPITRALCFAVYSSAVNSYFIAQYWYVHENEYLETRNLN